MKPARTLDDVTDVLWCRFLTYADFRIPHLLEGLGAAFDAEPDFRPDVMDERDPPRTKVTSMADTLAALVPQLEAPSRRHYMLIRKREPLSRYDEFQLHVDWRWIKKVKTATGWMQDDSDYIPSEVRLTWDMHWCDSGERLRRVVDYVMGLCEASQAYWGFIAHGDMVGQSTDFSRGKKVMRRSLPDVGWVNYFGKPLLDHWGGPGRLDGVGFQQRATPAGALIVQSTETPFVFNRSAKAIDDYPFKTPFYEALGPGTFHQPGVTPEEGVMIPTVTALRAAAPRLGGDM